MVGNCERVRIGDDPWVKGGGSYTLPKEVIESL
jgi:hypothetical protein